MNLIMATEYSEWQAVLDYDKKEFKWCPNEYTDEIEEVDWDHSISVPSLYDEHIDGIDLRVDFASQQSTEIHAALSAALETEHPYRNFSVAASRYGVDYAWMQYRDEAMEEWANQAAIEWCEENEIELLSDKVDVKNDPNFVPVLIA